MPQRFEIVRQLIYRACTYNNRCHSFIFQHPCQCHLRQSLSAATGDFIELSGSFNLLRGDLRTLEKAGRTCRPRSFRDTVQIFVRQHALCQWRESDESGTGFGCQRNRFSLNGTVEHAITILADKTRHTGFRHHLVSNACLLGRIFGYPDIKSLALSHDINQRLDSLHYRSHPVIPMAKKDIEILQSRAPETLVET